MKLEMVTKSNIRKFLIIFLFLVVVIVPGHVSAMTINVSVPEKYSEIKAGEKVYFETEVKWPENNGRKDLRIEYSVKNKAGGEVAYLKVLKAIETQASFMDAISIPESVSPGTYKISAKFSDYGSLSEDVAASFRVSKNTNSTQNYLIAIIGMLGVIAVFVVTELFVLTKRNNI